MFQLRHIEILYIGNGWDWGNIHLWLFGVPGLITVLERSDRKKDLEIHPDRPMEFEGIPEPPLRTTPSPRPTAPQGDHLEHLSPSPKEGRGPRDVLPASSRVGATTAATRGKTWNRARLGKGAGVLHLNPTSANPTSQKLLLKCVIPAERGAPVNGRKNVTRVYVSERLDVTNTQLLFGRHPLARTSRP